MKVTRLLNVTLMLFTLTLFSCLKNAEIIQPETTQKTVDKKLLDDYVNYTLQLEREYFLRKAGNIPTSSLNLSQEQFDKMIDNYLLNERIFLKQNIELQGISPMCGGCPPQTVFTGSAYVQGSNNTMSVTVSHTTNGSNTSINNSSYSFGGYSGTMAKVGDIEQSTHQGVITYKQIYSETIYLPLGTTRTKHVVVYGNITNGQMTVNAMPYTPPVTPP